MFSFEGLQFPERSSLQCLVLGLHATCWSSVLETFSGAHASTLCVWSPRQFGAKRLRQGLPIY
jgi:hypothetical protein